MTDNELLASITTIIAVLIGGFFTYLFKLKLDRRKEFNEIAEPLFEQLENQKKIAESGSFPDDVKNLTKNSFLPLKRRLPFYKKRGFDEAVQSYEKAKHECGYFARGGYVFSQPEVLLQAIKSLQKHMGLK
jgi:hypothetical protein